MIQINPRKVLIALLVVNFAFALLYVATQLTHKLEDPFNLDAEANIPAWYSGAQLLLIAIPAAIRGLQMKQENSGSHWKFYILAAIACVFLSADEVGMIHESIQNVLRDKMTWKLPNGMPANYVVAPAIYGVVGIALLVFFGKATIAFLKEPKGRAAIIIGGMMLVGGGAIVDILLPGQASIYEHAGEELLELCGASLMLFGFLVKLKPVTIEVKAD
jgi:hypothetical protein